MERQTSGGTVKSETSMASKTNRVQSDASIDVGDGFYEPLKPSYSMGETNRGTLSNMVRQGGGRIHTPKNISLENSKI